MDQNVPKSIETKRDKINCAFLYKSQYIIEIEEFGNPPDSDFVSMS